MTLEISSYVFSEKEVEALTPLVVKLLSVEDFFEIPKLAELTWFNTPIRGLKEDVVSMVTTGILGSSKLANLSPYPILGGDRPYAVCLIPSEFEGQLLATPGEFRGMTSINLKVARLPIDPRQVDDQTLKRFKDIADAEHPRFLRLLPKQCVIGGISIKEEGRIKKIKPFIINPLYADVLDTEKLVRIVSPKIVRRGGHQ